MYVGVDYYPEHWPRERWAIDAKLMRQAGFNVVRLAEFAWVFMEPEEGVFDFKWLDEALEVLAENGISVILGTPTAVMPAWLAKKYPETLATGKDGQRLIWGSRKNNCFSSGTYRLMSERITKAMSDHYGSHPSVIGWQTDNEFGHPPCFCHSCRTEFQSWLKTKYQTLDTLNKSWGTHFWGHLYSAWDEIPVAADSGSHNPSLCLDWQRFFSWLNVRFQADQVKILRKCCPKQFVTHNFMGMFSDLDYYDLARDLDHVSWDNYPVHGKPDIPYDASSAADVMRGLKRRNFWIMEQTAGPAGWGTFGRNPWPGEIRKIAWQQVAHGADGMIWFRWRTCTAGREQYWHGLLGHDGKPLRRYNEAAGTAKELHQAWNDLKDTTVKTDVAMIYDYDSIWALRIQPGFGANNYHTPMMRYYKALFRNGVNVDMIHPTQDFSGYKVIVAPDLFIMPDDLARRLSAFVANGGVLLTDCRSGVKDATNLCHDRTLPGLLSDALGISIEEYESLTDDMQYTVKGDKVISGTFTAINYSDWVTLGHAEALANYTDKHMKAFAAVTKNTFKKGTGYYVGCIAREDGFYDQLIADVLKTAAVTPILIPPPGVEVSCRAGCNKELVFLINHSQEEKEVDIPFTGATEIITGKAAGKRVVLEPFGVALLKLA